VKQPSEKRKTKTNNSGKENNGIYAVASGKGGVGKTWLAISLSHAIANLGRKTLLFDGDLGLANVDIQLGLMPKHDLGAVIGGKLSLNQALLSYEEGGFDIIAGRSGSGNLANITLNHLQSLGEDLNLLSSAYQNVVLDLGAGVERTVRNLATHVDTMLVITTDEPTALTDAYAFIKVTHMEQPQVDIRIVVNMANSTKEGERTYNTISKACEGFLKFSPPLAGVIRRDPKVRDSIRAQAPILTRFPNTEAAVDIGNIVKKLVEGQQSNAV